MMTRCGRRSICASDLCASKASDTVLSSASHEDCIAAARWWQVCRRMWPFSSSHTPPPLTNAGVECGHTTRSSFIDFLQVARSRALTFWPGVVDTISSGSPTLRSSRHPTRPAVAGHKPRHFLTTPTADRDVRQQVSVLVKQHQSYTSKTQVASTS
jgi:hypothetical protein